ncbi:MAG: hypothetical protein H7A47_16935 [Verrucomicrobiales bacterium]|nr:hypothetical protein [Verrucomicrobiales bacterium]
MLKLAYTAARWSHEMALREKTQIRPDKATLQKELARKLTGVFRCEGLGRLNTRGKGAQRTEVDATFHGKAKAAVSFSFSTKSTTDAVLDKAPEDFFCRRGRLLPNQGDAGHVPWLYRVVSELRPCKSTKRIMIFAWRSRNPSKRGPKLAEVKPLLNLVEEILHGSIELREKNLLEAGQGRRLRDSVGR